MSGIRRKGRIRYIPYEMSAEKILDETYEDCRQYGW